MIYLCACDEPELGTYYFETDQDGVALCFSIGAVYPSRTFVLWLMATMLASGRIATLLNITQRE